MKVESADRLKIEVFSNLLSVEIYFPVTIVVEVTVEVVLQAAKIIKQNMDRCGRIKWQVTSTALCWWGFEIRPPATKAGYEN
jgi:hypothetical protein